jgi:hypothetical protein
MRKERHDDYISRVGNLYKAIIGNVLDIRLAGECKNLELIHEFQEPFGEDVAAVIDNLIKSKNAGGLSEESLIEMNPVVKDPQLEKQRLKKEHEQYMKEQKDMYEREIFESAR